MSIWTIAPFLGRDLGQAPLHQRLAGRDDLHHGGVAGREIALDGADQGRRLHGGDQVIEEALLVRLEGARRRGLGLPVVGGRALAGDVGGLQGCGQVVVDDLEGARIGVVDADLLGGEFVLDELVLDALVRERARRIEAERLEVARQHLHGGDPAASMACTNSARVAKGKSAPPHRPSRWA